MELNWIEDFLALAATGSFSAAAHQRASTQPAFSRRIMQLEDWLGATLFNRGARPVSLTAAGQEFSTRARQLHDEIMDARRAALASRSNYAERQRIYTTNTLAISALPGWLTAQRIVHPSIVVASVFGCIDALQKGRADYALVPQFRTDPTLAIYQPQQMKTDRLVLAGTGNVIRQIDLQSGRLYGPVLMYTPGATFAAELAAAHKEGGLTLAAPPVAEGASAESLLALARAGLGAAWLPATLLDSTLAVIDLPGLPPITYDIVWLSRQPQALAAPL